MKSNPTSGTGNFTLCQQYVSQFIGATGEPNTAINGTFQPPLVVCFLPLCRLFLVDPKERLKEGEKDVESILWT